MQAPPQSFETPALNLAPAALASNFAPPAPKMRDAAPAASSYHAPAAPLHTAAKKEKGPSLLQRLTGAGWKAAAPSRQWQAQDSFDAPAATSKPRVPQSAAPAVEKVAMQGALAIDTPVKPAPVSVEDELDIPAFLRRQAN